MNRATMRPSAPFTPPNIDYHAGDTEMFKHLGNMMHRASHPVNVLTDVDPFNAPPWNLPPSVFYFLNSENNKSFKGEKVYRTTAAGYWHVTGEGVITLAQSPSNGWKTILEFYRGQAPYGDKTGWVMQAYTMDKLLGFSSLCRVFNRFDGSHSKEHPNDDADGELLKAQLLSMLDFEENINNLRDFSNMSQVINGNERGPPTISGSHPRSLLGLHNSAQDPVGGLDFSEEWNDISGGASSSSRSENTFASSMTLDDYFDSEALLRELETPIIPDTAKGQNPDCRFSVTASQGSHQVLIHPPPPAPLGGGSSSKRSLQNPRKNNMVYAPMPSMRTGESNNTHSAVSILEELQSKNVPKQGSTAYDINRVNQGLPTSQCADSVSARCQRRAVGGFTKPRKKYGCFVCFQFLSSVSTFFSRKKKQSEN